MENKIKEYREWLIFQAEMAEDAHHMYTKEESNELLATRAKFHAKGFRDALKELNCLFPPQREKEG